MERKRCLQKLILEMELLQVELILEIVFGKLGLKKVDKN